MGDVSAYHHEEVTMVRVQRMERRGSWLMVLEKGDKVIEAVTQFAKDLGIKAGRVSAIGAVSSVELGHFNVARKSYSWRSVTRPLEIVSLIGNIAAKDGETVVHAHIVVGTDEMELLGGHLKEAVVSATCEMVLDEFEGEIHRSHDSQTDLYLMDLEKNT